MTDQTKNIIDAICLDFKSSMCKYIFYHADAARSLRIILIDEKINDTEKINLLIDELLIIKSSRENIFGDYTEKMKLLSTDAKNYVMEMLDEMMIIIAPTFDKYNKLMDDIATVIRNANLKNDEKIRFIKKVLPTAIFPK
jgi:hypothetical protein